MATEEKSKEPKAKKEKIMQPLTKDEQKMLIEDPGMPPEGYTKVDPAIAVDEPAEEPKKDEKIQEEPKEEPKDDKKETLLKADEKEDFFFKLEREMQKPEGKENLTDFTPREKAYFYQMKRDRKLRQQAEEDRDKVLFRETKLKMEEKKPEPKEEEDPLKILEGKDPDDLLTVDEARKLFEKKVKTEAAKDPAKQDDDGLKSMQIRYLQMCEKESSSKHEDFYPVMELADDLISRSPEALAEISEKVKAGGQPAEVMYETIRNHKDFETLYPAAELRWKAKQAGKENSGTPSSVPAQTPEEKAKIEQAKQAEQTLEDNLNRPKTTAHVSSRETKPTDEMTFEEIARMSDIEFAKLPRPVRQRYLRKFEGV